MFEASFSLVSESLDDVRVGHANHVTPPLYDSLIYSIMFFEIIGGQTKYPSPS